MWMAYLSSMKSGSLSGDISKGQGLESSGGSSPFISATWAGVTQRLSLARTAGKNIYTQPNQRASWALRGIIPSTVFQETMAETQYCF